ncbi:MAG: hypothetical protein KIT85_03015 [Pseudolabrys sp.]|nr:hypothetical protein [Pseudolabrys sp.]MCA0342677.1 hypothetical protein [Pseudomonadota bacterium]MCW5683341.1 hypothetical protein [Pseudolabrys sp.]
MQDTDNQPSAGEGLRLQTAFAKISNAQQRRIVIELAEQFAGSTEQFVEASELQKQLADKPIELGR